MDHAVDCAQRPGLRGAALLARPNLGADELSGLSGPAALGFKRRGKNSGRKKRRAAAERMAVARPHPRELPRRFGHGLWLRPLRPLLPLGRAAWPHRTEGTGNQIEVRSNSTVLPELHFYMSFPLHHTTGDSSWFTHDRFG